MPYDANKHELEILKFWQENNIFERSVSERPENKPYVFYDGPPFATGRPHYGHIVASIMKDTIPRYKTMQGYMVERRWGWDCHGLPIENIIEKELKLRDRRALERYGIDRFNEACRTTVLKYASEWKKTIERIGRWVDMEHDYKTMDPEFMESVWWVFKTLYDAGLVYEGKKAMHICPRCVTPLSNFEVTLGYKDVTDPSVIWKFPVVGQPHTYLLAWTTTPWSTPGTMGLSVGPRHTYVKAKVGDEYVICAKERLEFAMSDLTYKIVQEMKGKELVGLRYEPIMASYKNIPSVMGNKNVFTVYAGDYVDIAEGTGIVTINGAYGEVDMEAAEKNGLPIVMDVDMDGKFNAMAGPYAGQFVKKTEDALIADMKSQGRVWRHEPYQHSYPHCWRCETALLNYATNSWFVAVTKIKDDLLRNNRSIYWVPEHIRDGRFGMWLENAKDWALSRNRFWGAPLPIWKSDDGDVLCLGSIKELETLSGVAVTDLHKHLVDPIAIEHNGRIYRRIPDVFDCWFESGAMPYGQAHYPFENKKKFEAGFPAEFIAEGQDQTRGWFYTLHVLATALTRGKKPAIPASRTTGAFRHCIVNGLVLAEDGKKMSKRLKNYPDPMAILEKYGADAMRMYLLSSPVMYGETLNFSEAGVREMFNKVMNTLWNVFEFYRLYAGETSVRLRTSDFRLQPIENKSIAKNKPKSESRSPKADHVLDRWIMARLNQLLKTVTEKMDAYLLAEASRPIADFVSDLSTWYVRRSRDRFKGEDEADKQAALATLREMLLTLSKVMAPFTPFIAEKIYLEITKLQNYEITGSVHLEAWPKVDKKAIDDKLIDDMARVRQVVELGLALRKEAGIRVRQPLQKFSFFNQSRRIPSIAGWFSNELTDVIADELNVKEVVEAEPNESDDWRIKESNGVKVALQTVITDELKKEGLVRELVRAINQLRKERGLTPHKTASLVCETDDATLNVILKEFEPQIKAQARLSSLKRGEGEQRVEIDGRTLCLTLQ